MVEDIDSDLGIECYNLGESALTIGESSNASALTIDTSCSILLVQAIHLMSRYHADSMSTGHVVPQFWGILGFGTRTTLQVRSRSNES
jgi:hypothetical protein